VLSGTISNLSATTITSILANPPGFYYNMHNGAFPGGAVRAQLVPEPSAMVLLAIGMCSLFAHRHSKSRTARA
jgi:hypothetical protein